MQYKTLRIRIYLCTLLLLSSIASAAHAAVVFRMLDLPIFQEQFNVQTRPLIAGLWGMEIPHSSCVEYYNFQENGSLNVESGAELSIGKYAYTLREQHETKLPILQMKILDENLQTDCSGQDIDQRGEVSQFFINWLSPYKIQFCEDENGNQCFASLNRVLP